MLAGGIGRNDGLAAALGQPIAQLAGVVGTVGDQLSGCRDALHQRRRADQIMGLSGRDGEGQRPAGVVGYGVNFGRPSAARAADGLLEVPPFAPAAERCALTWVESTAVVLTTPLDPLRV
jgi:hypothetical protein